MTRPQKAWEFVLKAWDFVFAVMLIGGSPLVVMFAGILVVSYFFDHGAKEPPHAWELVCGWAVFLILPLVTFCLACWWRRKRRVLPISLFPLELIAGLFFGAVSFVVLLVAWYAAFADN